MADEVNLDAGVAVTFVAQGSPLRHQLRADVHGLGLVMCDMALREFLNLVAGSAGPLETAWAQRFLSRVRTVPDSPSARAQRLVVTNNLGLNDILILGTGDALGLITLTTDRRAVSAALHQGVAFAVRRPLAFPFRGA